jgi:hypothetical protein
MKSLHPSHLNIRPKPSKTDPKPQVNAMNFEDTPEDCPHPGFFVLDLQYEAILVCWQCTTSFNAPFYTWPS